MSEFVFEKREKYTLNSDYALINDDIITNHRWDERVLELETINGRVCYISNNKIIANKYERDLSPWSQLYPKFGLFVNNWQLSFGLTPTPHEFDHTIFFNNESQLYKCIQMIRYCNQVREYDLKNSILLMKEKSLDLKQDDKIMSMIETFAKPYVKSDILSSANIYKNFMYMCIMHNRCKHGYDICQHIFDNTVLPDTGGSIPFLRSDSLLCEIEYAMLLRHKLDKYKSSLVMWFLIEDNLINNIYKYYNGKCFSLDSFSSKEQWYFEDIIEYFLYLNHVNNQEGINNISSFLISFLYSNNIHNYCKNPCKYNSIYNFIREFYTIADSFIIKIRDAEIMNDEYIPVSEFSKAAESYRKKCDFDAISNRKHLEDNHMKIINDLAKKIIENANSKVFIYNTIKMMVPSAFEIRNYVLLRRLFLSMTELSAIFNFSNTEFLSFFDERINIDNISQTTLENISNIFSQKYNIDEEYKKDVTWCLFNYYVLEYFSDKWLNTYHTSIDTSLTEDQFVDNCIEKNIISNSDNEFINLMVYYISNNRNKNSDDKGYPWERSRSDDVFNIGHPKLSLLSKIERRFAKYKSKTNEKEIEKLLEPVNLEFLNRKSKVIIEDSSIKLAVYNLMSMMPVLSFNIKNYIKLREIFLKDTGLLTYFTFPDYSIKHVLDKDLEKECISLLNKFSDVIVKRYNADKDYKIEITWCVFNYYVLEYFSEKWINTYHISIESTQKEDSFIDECLEKNLVTDNDVESIDMLVYYISKNSNDETNSDTHTSLDCSKNKDVFMIGKPRFSLLSKIEKHCAEFNERSKEKSFEERLFAPIDKGDNLPSKKQINIHDVDSMNGQQFEELITKLFIKMGYDAYTTKASGDQGIDVIAEKNGIKYGIQAKCYAGSVGNAAVQEAVAGRLFYGCDKIIVVTNSYFTKSAIELAEYNSVILWDRDILSDKLSCSAF